MQGLTKQEVKDREQAGKVNVKVSSSTRTVKQIVKDNVFTYFNLIFTVLALLLVIAGSLKDLTFMLIVFANTAIGILQEIRSKRTLDSLKILKMPKVEVLRDGKRTEVATEKLVIDDVIILRSGNQIPADAEVVEGSIQVNESLLTGEADEIGKSQGDALLSGSYVVSGECMAVLTAVGASSYIKANKGSNQGQAGRVRDDKVARQARKSHRCPDYSNGTYARIPGVVHTRRNL